MSKDVTRLSNNQKQLAQEELRQRARAIAREQRKSIIASLDQRELLGNLKELFEIMEPTYCIEVRDSDTSSPDMIIVKKDMMTRDVIGVVVKTGSIMSKTLDDINRVVTSVNEVFSITRETLHSHIQHAPCASLIQARSNRRLMDKVFVVLTGAISSRGRTMLARGGQGTVELFDGEWLVDSFTEFYPQVFYEATVANFIQKQIQILETHSWNNKGNLNLSDCFVEPLVRRMDVPLTIDETKIATAIATQRLPFSKLRTIVASKQKVLIVGDPGTGKSAALSKLGIELLRQSYLLLTKSTKCKDKPELPVVVAAKDLLNEADLRQFLISYFQDADILDRIQISVLMVDALDEISSQHRDRIVNRCREFAETLDCALIITSRKINFVNSTPTGYRKYELLPFEASQALKLFEKLHGNDELLRTLRDALNKIRFQIPMVPLSLLLLLQLVEENNEIPASLTELYDRYMDLVLGRHDKRKGIEVLFEYTIKKRFLADLAYSEFLNKARLEIPVTDYLSFVDLYATEYTLGRDYIGHFVEEVERAGVLHVSEKNVMFGHRSFLDYFAAFYMFYKRDELEGLDDLVVERYFNDFWCDTVFFYIGHKKEINAKLLEKLFSYAKEESNLKNNLDKFLIGRLLQAGWHSPTKTKMAGLGAAFDLVPDIRQGFLDYVEGKKWRVPTIAADFLILMLTDHSFRSNFLSKEVRLLLERNLEKSNGNSNTLITLFWAIKPFIDHAEAKTWSDKILELISSDKTAMPEEKARAYVMLKFVQQGDPDAAKAIQKKIKWIQNKNPGVFRKLLPQRLPGSMPPTPKRGTARRSK
jgi:hypothetical protein